ncbi:MAG TPA: RNA polymerase sigma factor [Bacillota bacterium]|nr:RNA polymerase sigma factor [Bacillota bacterium]HPZ90721.1 RNA polymerase sigma factor [Bacillota bacterium]HQE02602.1 RNA polymerase sigma factor [Bacillota bacterium]
MDVRKQVALAKSGDKEALLDLVMARQQEFYGLSYVYMRNEQDAADVLQDMMVILFTRIHTLKKASAFYSWAKQILVRCCLSRLRTNKRWQPIPEGYEQTTHMRADTGLDLLNAVHRLPASQRDVILLYYYSDKTFEEISAIMQCPVGTVKSRLHQGLKKLRGWLGNEYRGEA